MIIIEKLKKLQTFYFTITGEILHVKDIIFIKREKINYISIKAYGDEYILNEYGKMYINGECLVFPSKENKDWETIKISKFSQFEPVMCSNQASNEFVLRYHTGNISSDGYDTCYPIQKKEGKPVKWNIVLSIKEFLEKY